MKNNRILHCLTAITLIICSSAMLSAQTNDKTSTKIEITHEAELSPLHDLKTKNKMKEYVLLIRLPLNYGQAQATEVRDKWNALTDKWKADGIFVTSFVFPTESYLVAGKERAVKKEAIVTNETKVTTCIVLKAASYEEVLELVKLFPVLEQGGTVEVREAYPRAQAAENTDGTGGKK